MPYVKRDQDGKITQLLDEPSSDAREWLELNTSDVIAFLQHPSNSVEFKKRLTSSDGEMARVVEDLVDILMEKQVFVFTELPAAVQAKLNTRKRLRLDVNEISNLIGEDDNIL